MYSVLTVSQGTAVWGRYLAMTSVGFCLFSLLRAKLPLTQNRNWKTFAQSLQHWVIPVFWTALITHSYESESFDFVLIFLIMHLEWRYTSQQNRQQDLRSPLRGLHPYSWKRNEYQQIPRFCKIHFGTTVPPSAEKLRTGMPFTIAPTQDYSFSFLWNTRTTSVLIKPITINLLKL